ncbi:MAG: 4Fe-4S binding protein [Acidimicrobiaceae bacterium]|nr:4Fe-4S binding protein [Acidimicrobiaceae bacterium]
MTTTVRGWNQSSPRFEVVIDDSCTACGLCVITCPTRALRPAPYRPAFSARECTGCLDCVEICPRASISIN